MNEFYLIAKILSAGKDGFVKVQLSPGFYVNQDSIKFLYLDFWDQKKIVELEEVFIIKNSLFFKFKNFNDERDSSLFIGRNIFVLMSDLEKVKSSEITTYNLVGCRLFKGADLLGSVLDYFETPANPVIEIIKEDGNKILIPFVHSIFEKIDPENNILILSSDFGIDDNED